MTVKEAALQALEQARGTRISGAALAETLGVSRAAVHKAVDALRADGLLIDAAPGGGYLLHEEDDSLTASGISALLDTQALGRALLVVDTVDSTNTALKERYADRPHGFTLVAAAQTSGRGRLGRSFASPAGTGLYLSVLLRPSLPLAKLPLVTVAAAVAAAEAIEQTAGFSPRLKWVNDVLMDGRKLCGILTEASIEGETGAVTSVVVGAGFNLRQNPDWPEEVRAVAGALETFGQTPRRAALAAAFLGALERALKLLAADSAALVDVYRARLCCIGQQITVVSPRGSYEADCVGLTDDAGLLVRTADGQIQTLHTGEISIRLPQ